MSARPFIPDRSLTKALARVLGPSPCTVLVGGSPRVAAALGRAGHAVTLWRVTSAAPLGKPPAALERYDALILMDVLARRTDPLGDLRNLVRRARPDARLALVEQAAWGSGGRWISRLIGRFTGRPVVMEAAELNALCLNAGLIDLRQTWPQGLRSLVLTTGRVHRLAGMLD